VFLDRFVAFSNKTCQNTFSIYTFVTSPFCHTSVIGHLPNSPDKIIKALKEREREKEKERERERERKKKRERERE
jgi:hypothetical protein